MKKKTVIISSVTAVVVILAVVVFLKGKGNKEVQFNTAQIEEKTIEITVTATGYVQPVDKVEVGTQVSGVIEKIFVDYNSQVTKGQLLAEIDKSTLSENLTQAKAGLSSSESELKYAQQNYDRAKQLYDVKAATEASYEEAVNRLAQAETSLAKAKANLHQAQVNLSYAEIYSPIDGVILDRSVEQGQTVAASFNTPTLFTIANDLKRMQVEADVDEADIGRVRVGQKVNFTVDAYSDDTFEGLVNQLRLQPTVTNNVVTYTVIIEAPNPEEKLFPGMTASVTIITETETGLSVPAEALNFNPTPEIFAHLKMKPESDTGQKTAISTPDFTQKAVWMKTPEGIVRKEIKTGFSDGIYTIVKEGLETGNEVILSATIGKKELNQEQAANPFMPQPPRRR
ncbi:MAG: efflux RND transporter periplasmic adaptor subunit [Dysgonamonadaceae bacterium]|jgi:HlyD family secretion protein|nr:efflux RND transporter periplasmic adaptor subunit [Dysgonamonadaceae bacterium]